VFFPNSLTPSLSFFFFFFFFLFFFFFYKRDIKMLGGLEIILVHGIHRYSMHFSYVLHVTFRLNDTVLYQTRDRSFKELLVISIPTLHLQKSTFFFYHRTNKILLRMNKILMNCPYVKLGDISLKVVFFKSFGSFGGQSTSLCSLRGHPEKWC
jgi:hypothetical protein